MDACCVFLHFSNVLVPVASSHSSVPRRTAIPQKCLFSTINRLADLSGGEDQSEANSSIRACYLLVESRRTGSYPPPDARFFSVDNA